MHTTFHSAYDLCVYLVLGWIQLLKCSEHCRLAVAAENEHSVSGKVEEKHQTGSKNTDRVPIITI